MKAKTEAKFKKGDAVIVRFRGRDFVGYITEMEYWSKRDNTKDPEYWVAWPGNAGGLLETIHRASKLRHLTTILK